MSSRRTNIFALIGPGMLIAATGVGAGDLATASLVGHELGVAIAWAAVVGAGLKFVLNEGVARFQLATGQTVLEGSAAKFGKSVQILFLMFLIGWSYTVAAALISASGVAGHALIPVFETPERGKIVWGIIHSLIGLVLVRLGGFRVFEKVMGVCTAIMFATVIATMFALRPDFAELLQGLVVPRIPKLDSGGLSSTVALVGGIGGTVTVLCYGYWIREQGRAGVEDLRICRIDLASGYAMTALFGVAMVVIGSRLPLANKPSASLLVTIADQLRDAGLGFLRYPFLIGAWGAIFTSLLGVWQSVPYMFADSVNLLRRSGTDAPARDPIDTSSLAYRGFLYAIAFVPMISLLASFRTVQLTYAIVGAAFMPILAVALLFLNGDSKRVGSLKNSWMTMGVLVVTIVCFIVIGIYEIRDALPKPAAVEVPASTQSR